MTWFTDSQINADAGVDKPVKARTINRIQQNITAAFNGDPGSPPLAAAVAGEAYSNLALNAIGSQRLVRTTLTSQGTEPNPPANPYMAGTEYPAAGLGLPAGSWMALGGGYTGAFTAVGADPTVYTYFYFNLFVRVS